MYVGAYYSKTPQTLFEQSEHAPNFEKTVE